MQPGLTDSLDDVDADPAAVFEAHDADTVDELVAGGSEPATGEGDDVAVSLDDGLFAEGLEPPARERRSERSEREDGSSEANDVLAHLERAADAAPRRGDARDRDEEVADATDAEVQAAIVAAEEVYEGELPDEIPFE